MRRSIFFLPILLCHLLPLQAWAQIPDSSFYQAAIDGTKSAYTMSQGEQARLFSGLQFVEYRYPFLSEHPFFANRNATIGSIRYDGRDYHDIPMWYDLIKHELVVLDEVNQRKIVLQSGHVTQFSLSGHDFVKIDSFPGIPGGYYDRLYPGSTTLLAKRSKRPLEVIDEMTVKIDISSQSPRYYIAKGGSFRELKKPASIKKELAGKRREIETYIKTNKLSFRRNPEESMVKILAYYDSITSK